MVRADVFNGFFCGFDSCGSAAFPNFRGGNSLSRPCVGTKAVQTNSRIEHHVGNVKTFWFASPVAGRGIDFSNIVPMVGVEPTRGCPHWILSPARLPAGRQVYQFHHRGLYEILFNIFFSDTRF